MGNDAAKYLYDHMTEEMWNEYMQMNAGEAAKAMKEWLASSGYKAPTPGSAGGRASETHSNTPTGDEDEDAIIHELTSGRPYTDSSGKTWTSLTEWYAAHPPK